MVSSGKRLRRVGFMGVCLVLPVLVAAGEAGAAEVGPIDGFSHSLEPSFYLGLVAAQLAGAWVLRFVARAVQRNLALGGEGLRFRLR